ncbi:MAG: protein kinase, partial [Thermoplasmata archaeon]
HRDLKPQNVMVDEDGNARIMDFGIARSLESKGITGAGVMIGTPEYMSPEQVEGKEAGQSSDIYSLGVILYEMVTGRVPFKGDTPFTIGVKHKSEMPKDPKELNAQIPEDLSTVIMRCLEKDKEKRYQSAGEMRSELENIQKGIPTTERVVPERKPLTSREITVQFSMKKLFLPALVFVALIAAGLIIWQFLPQKEIVKSSIAVVSFENQSGDNAYDYLQKAIPNLLITSLEQSKYLRVTTWERMHDLLKQMGKEEAEVIDKDLGFELCRMDGVDAIVLGSFVKAGDMFATDVKVLDVETKSLLRSASSKGEGVRSILEKQIDELSKEISRGVGLSERRIKEAQKPIADVTTTSMDAYNYFLKGTESHNKFYYEDARQFLEKAVELDPTFASAYIWLAFAYGGLGDTKASNEAVEKAKTFSKKATDKERLFIEAFYAYIVKKDQVKYFRLLKQLAAKYPKDEVAHHLLGLYYKGENLYYEAVEEFNKALELDPYSGFALNDLAYTYAEMENFEKAIEYFKRYASAFPGDANPIDSMAECYFLMGRLDEAIAKYKEALEVKPDFHQASPSIGYIYAFKENYAEAMRWADKFISMAPSPGIKSEGFLIKGFYHYWLGSFEQSLEDLRRAKDLAEAVGNEVLKSYAEWMKAWIYYDRGELQLSRRHFKDFFDLAIENYPEYTPLITAAHKFRSGLVDLKEGHIDSAKTKLERMKSLLPNVNPGEKDGMRFRYDIFLAETLVAENSFDQAIAVCEKASPLEISSMYT